ncbi:SGNH/GDSL hydrolase family protein [Galbitalea sp. SE-J8]|uniref:SGNH/GDSL hydrolase family protein n=1 Tax=Galbitalea sp. SE-J8 TaxID=3054952 RepID=UPI00259C836B|nr:SGNH/GDSL hydrolase family protein [Galbitalea sp. SE-J8]MDM4763582.1 SGNH/GDSL hydrolase family protein [Galbitalea sp. SE-J8]
MTPGTATVAFYGDSYTEGIGASDPSLRWSTIVCAARGWREHNVSVNGLGFVRNRVEFGDRDTVQQTIDARPDIVVVTMGLNDNFAYPLTPAAIREQIGRDLRRIRSALPDARLIVVEPFWYTDERPESVPVIIGWVRAAAAAVGADWVPGASRWIEGRPEWMASDGLHPNDAGYAELARRMDAALAALGL